MANKKLNQLVTKPSIASGDLFPIADATTGQLYKTTISDLGTAIGSGVSSVNGLVGAVVLDTDDIQELASPVNKWFTDLRARAAISVSSPLAYNSGTGLITIAQATGSANGYLSSTDWTTFNSKQAALSGTGFVKISGTTISYDNSTYLTTSAAATNYVPYTGATANVNLGLNYSLTAALIIKSGGTSTQFLKADGSIDTNTYLTTGSAASTYLPLSGGTISGDLTISSTNPRIYLTDTDNNPDYFISNTDGTFTIYDVTSATSRFTIGTTGNVNILSKLNLSGAVTGIGNSSNYTVTASSGLAASKQITSSIIAAANNDVLVGLDVNPTFTNGAFTGVSNYALRLNTASATGVWNIYASGTANNYLAGSLGIGSASLLSNGLADVSLRVSKNITGATTNVVGVKQDGTVQSDATGVVSGYQNELITAAASFTVSNYYHFRAFQNVIGAGSAVTTQAGFVASGNIVSATNNYGFWGAIPSGGNRYNLYMSGTADNYFAGSLGIGSTSLTGFSLRVSKSLSGSTVPIGILSDGTAPTTATGNINYFRTIATTDASLTSGALNHYSTNQGTFGAGTTITNQHGFIVDSTLIGATNNFGFRGLIPSGSNRWNLYMDGTANNYLAGNLLIGSTTDNSFKLQVTGSASISGGLQVPTINQTYLGASKTSLYADASRYAMQTVSGYAIAFEPGGTEKMRITDTGNVGIGTTSPGYKLDIQSGQLRVLSGNSSNPALIIGEAGGAGTTNQGTLQFGDANSSFKIQGGNDYVGMLFTSGGSERMRIVAGGQVGIGTSSPQYLLDVNGTGRFSGIVRVEGSYLQIVNATNPTMYLNNTTVQWRTYLPSGTNNYAISDAVRDVLTLGYNGGNSYFQGCNVGIGTTAPSFVTGGGLAVFSTSADTRIALKNTASGDTSTDGFHLVLTTALEAVIENRENASMRFLTNATEAMRITAAGNVLIGKTSGSSKFAVVGLPTSSAGLASGDFYQSAGVVMVVP